jgi:ferritin-like metal-binding protein YciE
MADLNERDAKLVQYLSEAYGKEQELVTSLEAHIAMTTRDPYKKRLKAHLKETKAHAKGLERRIKKLGGGGQLTQNVAGKAKALAKGPLHMVRGGGEQEKMLKNAKTEYWNEHEEIATYLAIEALATKVNDAETAKLAREIRREEERMAKFLEGQIKSLSGAVAGEDIPAAQRRGAKAGKAKSGKAKAAKSKSAGAKAGKAKAAKTGKAKAGKAKAAAAKRASGAKAKAKSGASKAKTAGAKKAAKAKRGGKAAARARS